MEFEWDGKKAANLRKHGVSFKEAALIFKGSRRAKSLSG
jgi:uncharacterized DUF497 family protein